MFPSERPCAKPVSTRTIRRASTRSTSDTNRTETFYVETLARDLIVIRGADVVGG